MSSLTFFISPVLYRTYQLIEGLGKSLLKDFNANDKKLLASFFPVLKFEPGDKITDADVSPLFAVLILEGRVENEADESDSTLSAGSLVMLVVPLQTCNVSAFGAIFTLQNMVLGKLHGHLIFRLGQMDARYYFISGLRKSALTASTDVTAQGKCTVVLSCSAARTSNSV